MNIFEIDVKSVLTRTTNGFLKKVASHSLQSYSGCAFGNAACGVACYVQHSGYLIPEGESWGSFLLVKRNAVEVYRRQWKKERDWTTKTSRRFGIFMSSSTDPFVPQEDRFRITFGLLEAMVRQPPDFLIIQTHTARVLKYVDMYPEIASKCGLRFHISIESDLDTLPGLPPPASSVHDRFEAAAALKSKGLRVVITVSPLWPIQKPKDFFRSISETADAVVIDHFIQGDGTPHGTRTKHTELPEAMKRVEPKSVLLSYRDEMVAIAQEFMPGRVGVNVDGFAGTFLP